MKHPTLSIDVVVDGVSVQFETQISIREEINSISGFTIGYGDQYNLRRNRIRTGSNVQIYLSWGTETPVLYCSGSITRLPKNVSRGNIGVTATGSDNGILVSGKQAWDSNYQYLEYTNRRASDILSNLMSFVPTVSASIKPYAGEPTLSWECSTGSSIIDNVKSICEYSGYEWLVMPDGSMRIRKILDSTLENCRYMMLLGEVNDFDNLPTLPYIYIRGISIGKDNTKIRNFYKVEGKGGIYGVGFNQYSINQIGRRIEGYHSDERLTSVQACQVAARTLSNVNGESSRPISINASGITEVRPGDVVYLASSKDRFDILPGYYRLLKKTSNIGGVGWRSEYTFGRLKRNISDLLGTKN